MFWRITARKSKKTNDDHRMDDEMTEGAGGVDWGGEYGYKN